jgi:hypothetical protein
MDKVNELFNVQVTNVVNAFPSVYTKDDVVKILDALRHNVVVEVSQMSKEVGITELKFQEFNANVRNSLETSLNNGTIDIYDTSSAEFSIDYRNTIIIETIDFNSDAVTEELDDILLTEFQAIFGDLITSNEE